MYTVNAGENLVKHGISFYLGIPVIRAGFFYGIPGKPGFFNGIQVCPNFEHPTLTSDTLP